MSISAICLCISGALLLAFVVMRVARSRRRQQTEEIQGLEDEMQQRFREIDSYVAEGYYPLVKTLEITGMTDERLVFLVQNALQLVCPGTKVGISAEYGQAVVYLKEPVDNGVLEDAVAGQGCLVLSIKESNQEVRN